MRWIRKSQAQKDAEHMERIRKWHSWFAWKPVHRTNFATGEVETVWLQEVWRRCYEYSPTKRKVIKWQYIFDDFEMLRYNEAQTRDSTDGFFGGNPK